MQGHSSFKGELLFVGVVVVVIRYLCRLPHGNVMFMMGLMRGRRSAQQERTRRRYKETPALEFLLALHFNALVFALASASRRRRVVVIASTSTGTDHCPDWNTITSR